MEIEKWSEHERLEFRNQEFDHIFLNDSHAKPNPQNFDFNTELYFENCKIKSFGLVMICTGRLIEFIDCSFGEITCISPMFDGGFRMNNCTVSGKTMFDAGMHNKSPNEFTLENCVFSEFVDFFDVKFDGPVHITNNKFLKGTNLCIYLSPPIGIAEGQKVLIDGNSGELSLYAVDDPFNPANRSKN